MSLSFSKVMDLKVPDSVSLSTETSLPQAITRMQQLENVAKSQSMHIDGNRIDGSGCGRGTSV